MLIVISRYIGKCCLMEHLGGKKPSPVAEFNNKKAAKIQQSKSLKYEYTETSEARQVHCRLSRKTLQGKRYKRLKKVQKQIILRKDKYKVIHVSEMHHEYTVARLHSESDLTSPLKWKQACIRFGTLLKVTSCG